MVKRERVLLPGFAMKRYYDLGVSVRLRGLGERREGGRILTLPETRIESALGARRPSSPFPPVGVLTICERVPSLSEIWEARIELPLGLLSET